MCFFFMLALHIPQRKQRSDIGVIGFLINRIVVDLRLQSLGIYLGRKTGNTKIEVIDFQKSENEGIAKSILTINQYLLNFRDIKCFIKVNYKYRSGCIDNLVRIVCVIQLTAKFCNGLFNTSLLRYICHVLFYLEFQTTFCF